MVYISVSYVVGYTDENGICEKSRFVIFILENLTRRLEYATDISIGKRVLTILRGGGGRTYIPFDILDIDIDEATKSRLVEQRSLTLLYGGS